MFVSRAEALARLSSDQNRLRVDYEPTKEKPVSERNQDDPSTAGIEQKKSTEDQIERALDELQDPKSPNFLSSLDRLDSMIHPRRGRGVRFRGNDAAQAAIAETSIVLGPRAAERIFDYSEQATSAMARGSIGSHYAAAGIKKPVLDARVKEIRKRIALSAGIRLQKIVRSITPEKIEEVKSVTELARMGKDVASIMDHAMPKDEGGEAPAQFHIYRPEIREEKNFTQVTINVAKT